MHTPIEAQYPDDFRSDTTQELLSQLKARHSVTLIGMKRVGISNFLRYFLYHQSIQEQVADANLIFIVVDLHDLIDLTQQSFWNLMFKRLYDVIMTDIRFEKHKEATEKLLDHALTTQDQLFTIDACKKLILFVQAQGLQPVLFLLRFDRILSEITPQLFANLQGLVDVANQNLCYVFTSVKPFSQLRPQIFRPAAVSVFARDIYMLPASEQDMMSIMQTFLERYELKISKEQQQGILDLACGHVQYLQLALIRLKENGIDKKVDLKVILEQDEEIRQQSAELVSVLSPEERTALFLVADTKTVDDKQRKDAHYLWDVGVVKKSEIFSPLLKNYCSNKDENGRVDFTKKEKLLFELLKRKLGETVERDEIIEDVWPDQVEMGVTDWAIDKLVARVRKKLKQKKLLYRIKTVVTRGYRLEKV